MPNNDLSNTSTGTIVAEMWNRTHSDSTGLYMVPSNGGGFVVVDTAGNQILKAA